MHILWDFDGTIFDTYPSMLTLLQEHFLPDQPINSQEALAKLKLSFKDAFEYYGLPVEESYNQLHRLELQIPPKDKPPFPFVKEVLEKADLNVIVTHKSRHSVEAILNYYAMNHYFKEIICMEDGFKRKPNPESYQYLHEKYHLDLVVGDRDLDLAPARLLGIKTCAFQNSGLQADFHLQTYRKFPLTLKL